MGCLFRKRMKEVPLQGHYKCTEGQAIFNLKVIYNCILRQLKSRTEEEEILRDTATVHSGIKDVQ